MKKLVLTLAFLAGPGLSLPNDAQPRVRPRLFVAERDPFAGLPALRARWAAGERPSPDLPGLALSWLLSGDPSFAQVTSGVAPGAPVWRATAEAGDESTPSLPWDAVRDGRLRLRRLR